MEKTVKDLNFVRKMQQKHGYSEMQSMIESGLVWHMEGSMGRAAMRALESGECFLGSEAKKDYWGNTVPSRDQVQPGTKGSLQNSVNYWKNL